MAGRTAAALAVLVICAASCGGGGDDGEQAASSPTPTRTPTATPTETPRPDPPPKRARSTKDCLAIWNRDEQRGSGSQVSHTDFLADLAQQGRTPVRVEYSRPSCFVVAEIGPRRVAIFVTVRNHAFYDQPRRENIPEGRVVNYNARALEDGRIAMR